MKRILCFTLVLLLALSGCMAKPEVTEEPELPVITEENTLPQNMEVGKLNASVLEISEASYIEFEDNGTKIKLENSDGKYFLVNYTLENKEEFEIDIDHSLDVILVDEEGEKHYGEYYEYPTGKENITVKPQESANIMFVSDIESNISIKTVILKYADMQTQFDIM